MGELARELINKQTPRYHAYIAEINPQTKQGNKKVAAQTHCLSICLLHALFSEAVVSIDTKFSEKMGSVNGQACYVIRH